MASVGMFLSGVGVSLAWYCLYCIVEFFIIMYIMDEIIRRLLCKPEMSHEGRMKLLMFEMCIIAVFGLFLFIYHHFPLCSILRIWCCLYSTRDTWQLMCRRYWEDFLEFESFQPRQFFAPPMQTVPTSPTSDAIMRNGGVVNDPTVTQQTRPQPHTASKPPKSMMFANPLKSLQNAMASLRRPQHQPAGLINKTQNLCSVNVVLQLLAGTPILAESLVRETPRIKDTGIVRDFITELAGLLSDLRRSNETTLSSQHLMELAEKLQSPQPQTDSVEWLMWVLEIIHAGFLPPGTTEMELNMQRYKLLCAVPLAQPLLMLYKHNQVPRALASMKAECLDKIDHAHALQVSTYADPIQRLTEVEWLSHKLMNPSIIDEMFTGQVVESHHCRECHHLSVSVQPFKVLPLSIPVRPYGFSFYRDLTLDDCLFEFAKSERLFGSNGLNCKHCEVQKTSCRGLSTQTRIPGLCRNKLDSGLGCDSSFIHRGGPSESGFLSPIRPHPEDMENSLIYNRRSVTCEQPPLWNSSNPLASDTTSSVFNIPQATSSPIRQAIQKSVVLSEGERQALISQLPDSLILQIIRMTFKEGQPSKVKTPITIPLTNLDMSALSSERCLGGDHKASANGCYKYNLYTFIVHLGENSVARGHYVTYSQTSNGSWFCFDDEKVSPVNIDYAIMTRQVRENVCLLCYRKAVC